MRSPEGLLSSLSRDSMARLRYLVLGRAGICPLSLRAGLVSNRRIIAYACQMVLDMEGKAALPGEEGAGFDMDRFMEMKEAANGRI